MKNYIVGLSILSITLFTFSCKKEAHENKAYTDSLSSTSQEQNIQEKNTEIKIIASNFESIQKLPVTNSDTLYITNYWATWCPPCIKEIPDFLELQNQYKNKTVKFTFVSVDNPNSLQSEVTPFAVKHKMEKVYMIPIHELENFNSFNPELTQGIPVTIIQKGKNKEGFIGGLSKDFLTQKIEEYLTKK